MLRLLLALLLCLPLPVFAKSDGLTACTTSVNGEPITLNYNPDDETVKDNQSFREWLRGEHKGLDCPAFVTLRYLTPELDDTQRGPFCLAWDKETRTYSGFAEGERDRYLACEKPTRSFCERVSDTADSAALISGLRKPKDAEEEDYLKHSSGAVILRGGDTIVTRSLSDALRASLIAALGTAVTAVGAPAAATTLVAVGGAVYVCREK
ncbi:hypothetical protein [Primorskyibacter flagellatus]|uniref:hypothetical protein n=1 Tax=Primorskyibacter flagellatus TaxID=1387277 RepID=UPI0016634712|nr:hypothetical protein [Primorskyibacter flagellatus]